MNEFNFKDSIKIGVEKANVAKQNKLEIENVFDEFSKAYLESSNNIVDVKIKTRYKSKRPNNFGMSALSSLMNLETIEYDALVLSNDENEYEIAEIIEHTDGYPIAIKIGDVTSTYNDKESLIKGLSRLASSTEVGNAFEALLDNNG